MSKKIITLSVISVFSAIILLWLLYPPTINVSDEVSSSDEEIEKGKYDVTYVVADNNLPRLRVEEGNRGHGEFCPDVRRYVDRFPPQ